jgi:hypothetical protein
MVITLTAVNDPGRLEVVQAPSQGTRRFGEGQAFACGGCGEIIGCYPDEQSFFREVGQGRQQFAVRCKCSRFNLVPITWGD